MKQLLCTLILAAGAFCLPAAPPWSHVAVQVSQPNTVQFGFLTLMDYEALSQNVASFTSSDGINLSLNGTAIMNTRLPKNFQDDPRPVDYNGNFFVFLDNAVTNTTNISVSICSNIFGVVSTNVTIQVPGPTYDLTGVSNEVWNPKVILLGGVYYCFVSISTNFNSSEIAPFNGFKTWYATASDNTLTNWNGGGNWTQMSIPTANTLDPWFFSYNGNLYEYYKNETSKYVELAESTTGLTGTFTTIESGNWTGWGSGFESISLVFDEVAHLYKLFAVDYGNNTLWYATSSTPISGWSALSEVNAGTYDSDFYGPSVTPMTSRLSLQINLLTNLYGWFLFNEGNGTTAGDSAFNHDNGTLSGSSLPTWTSGPTGEALSFNGTSAYLAVPSGDQIPANTSFSVSCWVNVPTIPSAYEGIVDGGNLGGGGTDGWGVAWDSAGQIYLGLGTGYLISSQTFSANTWYNVVFTVQYNGGASACGINCYVNGVLKNGTSANVDSWTGSGSGINVGAAAGPTGDYMSGKVGDVRLFNSVIPASVIGSLQTYQWIP